MRFFFEGGNGYVNCSIMPVVDDISDNEYVDAGITLDSDNTIVATHTKNYAIIFDWKLVEFLTAQFLSVSHKTSLFGEKSLYSVKPTNIITLLLCNISTILIGPQHDSYKSWKGLTENILKPEKVDTAI